MPRAELFWWAEDNEYCHWRIPQAGYRRRLVDGAVVQHDAVRQGARVPLWKYYYEARNMLYLHLHVMHRVGWYPRNVTKLVARALLRERGRRLVCLRTIALGLRDGAMGRLGIRFPVEPMPSSAARARPARIASGRGEPARRRPQRLRARRRFGAPGGAPARADEESRPTPEPLHRGGAQAGYDGAGQLPVAAPRRVRGRAKS